MDFFSYLEGKHKLVFGASYLFILHGFLYRKTIP